MGEIIQSLPLPVFLVIVAFPLGLGGLALFAGFHARRRAAIVKATPTSPIGTAEDGYRELEGTVDAIGGQPLSSPLTNSPCCWFRARVERWSPGRGSGGTGHWKTVRDATSSAPFFVRDATGVCVVRPWGAEVTPKDRSVWQGATEMPEDRNPPRVPPTGSATGPIQVVGIGMDYRYTEERIYPGDPLVVLGDFTSGRFAPPAAGGEEAADEDDLLADAEDEVDQATDEPASDDPFDDTAVCDQLTERAHATARASIGGLASMRVYGWRLRIPPDDIVV
jgi:hypothetical protein